MNRFKFFILGVFLLSACSTQYRDALPQISQEELAEVFEDIAENAGDSTVKALSARNNIFGSGQTITFYHAREEDGRPAASILSVEDMSFFKWDIDVPSYAVLSAIDVIFVDSVDDSGERVFSLMLKMGGDTVDGNPIYFVSSSQPGEYRFTDDEFEVRIPAANGNFLLLRTRDLSDNYSDTLAGSIKLDIYVEDDSVDGVLLGQISTMSGFGNR